MKTIKLKKFSDYDLIDKKDFYQQVYKHLIKTKQSFCFTSIGLISREDCESMEENNKEYGISPNPSYKH